MFITKPRRPVLNRQLPIIRGMVAAFAMFEGGGSSIRDLSPYNGIATLQGSAAWRHTGNFALDCNRSSASYADMPHHPGFAFDRMFTVFHRFYVDTLVNYNCLSQKGPTNAGQPWDSWVNSVGTIRTHIDGVSIDVGPAAISVNTWTNHVFTYQNPAITVYLDGIQRGTGTKTNATMGTANLRIGRRADGGTQLDGAIEVLYVWNRVLSHTEIWQLQVDHYLPFRPPPIRIGLSVAPSTTTVALSWTDNSVGETGYSIERSTDGINYSEIGTAAADATSYNDETAALATTYYYRVKATGSPADSDYSNVATITTA